MDFTLHPIDYTVIGLYFLLILGIGFYVARRTQSGEDLFLGGRSFGWGLIALSLFASNISSTTLIGLSGSAYSSGIVQSVYEWLSGVPLIIAAAIFVPLYLRARITTIPEFLELRYDRRSRLIFSAVTIFISIIVDTAGGLYAGALVLKVFFPELVLWQTCLVLALVAGVYTAFGGLKAVVYTDALQAVILIVGCSVMTYLLYQNLDFDWDTVLASTPEDHFSVVRPLDDPGLPWTGLLLGVPFLGFWYWTTNQYIVQRVLGAKDIPNARLGVIAAGFLKIIPLFIMVIPGALAITQIPQLENSDQVFPIIVTTILPVGMVGLVLAGLVSAILSSVDSTLNSASTLVVKDFVEQPGAELTEGRTVRAGRIATLVFMVVAALWAPMIENFDGIWIYLQQMFSIIVPPVVVLFLVGTFYRRGNGHGAFWTLVIGFALGALLFALGQFGLWNFHFTSNVGIMIAVCTLIFVVFSRATPAPSLDVQQRLTYQPGLIAPAEGKVVWYRDYRIWMVILVVLMGYLLVVFW